MNEGENDEEEDESEDRDEKEKLFKILQEIGNYLKLAKVLLRSPFSRHSEGFGKCMGILGA